MSTTTLDVAVIGDRDAAYVAQDSIAPALAHAAAPLGARVRVTWIPTPDLLGEDAGARLADADLVWSAPGSPYRSRDGALAGIRAAREAGTPFLGTCAGFQHGVLEVARDVLGARAGHREYGDADDLFIGELRCSLADRDLRVELEPPLAAIYGTTWATERFHCRFGLNESRLAELAAAGLVPVGRDAFDGATRAMTLLDHPCFWLTLFVPQVASRPGAPHPLVAHVVQIACTRVRERERVFT